MAAVTDAGCPFCALEARRIFHAGALTLGLWDAFPVNPGHALLVPKRHVASWFDATSEEQAELMAGVALARQRIEESQPRLPDGYNVGINVGAEAGQTVLHLHVHVIPRYAGDVPDPRGGVRHVVPRKANYLERSKEPSQSAGEPAGWLTTAPHPRALVVGGDDPLLPHLLTHVDEAQNADVAVAFVLESGLDLIEDHLVDLLARKGRVRMLTGDYLGVTDPRALRRLLDLQRENAELAEMRILEVPRGTSFHPKAYILSQAEDVGVAFVGSSNLTGPGLKSGVEWNFRTVTSRDVVGFRDVANQFDRLFRGENTHALSDEWIELHPLIVPRPPMGRTKVAAGLCTENAPGAHTVLWCYDKYAP